MISYVGNCILAIIYYIYIFLVAAAFRLAYTDVWKTLKVHLRSL